MVIRRAIFVQVTILAATLLFAPQGLAQPETMTGNSRHEAPYAERGVAAQIWVYPWTTMSPDGRHVSSIYAHHQDYNPYEGDGIFDGVTHNFIHAEVGLAKHHGYPTLVFWQYNKNPLTIWDFKGKYVTSLPSSGYYVYFEINNVDMQNNGYGYWRMAYDGQPMETARLNMSHARSIISAERLYPADDMRSQFRYLKVKRNNGVWEPWVNCRWAARGDPGWAWSSYNAAHWFSYKL